MDTYIDFGIKITDQPRVRACACNILQYLRITAIQLHAADDLLYIAQSVELLQSVITSSPVRTPLMAGIFLLDSEFAGIHDTDHDLSIYNVYNIIEQWSVTML